MAFGWVIRHQKKALFVLAVVLIVGWGLSGMIYNLLSVKKGPQADTAIAQIAGVKVKMGEFLNFKRSWGAVFPGLLGRNARENRAPGDNSTIDQVAWAYLGLMKMAEGAGMQVSDKNILDEKRYLYQSSVGRNARLDEAADKWFREQMGMTGQQVDEILRQRLMAEKMARSILEGIESTRAGAWAQYCQENRAVRVKYVAFPGADFLAKTAVPTEDNVTAFYEANKGFGRTYFNPATVQIEYVALLLSKLEGDVKIATDDMMKYYNDNKDLLYKLRDAKDGKEAEYILFPEVKSEIEEMLKRRAVQEKASALMDSLTKAFATPGGKPLEDVVKGLNAPALEYHKTPFLTEVHLLEIPGIGLAHAEGKGLGQLAFEVPPTPPVLSPVMSSEEGLFVFRPAAAVREGAAPELALVKDRVTADIRKAEALKLAFAAASAFDNEVTKAGGAEKFDEVALKDKLAVKETPFFINNYYDVNRPDFIDRASPLDLGAFYGPNVSVRDSVAAVIKVVEQRAADPAGFAGEEKIKRDNDRAVKIGDLKQTLVPRAILKFAGYKELVSTKTEASSESDN